MDRDLREKVEWTAFVFPRTVRSMAGDPEDEATLANLTMPQWDVLFALDYRGPCSLKRLTRALGISQSSSSELVDRLVRLEYIAREPEPDNRRMLSLRLTDKAQAAVNQRKEALITRFQEAISLLSPSEQADLLSSFETIFDLMKKVKERMHHSEHGAPNGHPHPPKNPGHDTRSAGENGSLA